MSGNPDDIEEYLEKNPDFFQNRDLLLQKMGIKVDTGISLSLLERQVRILKETNTKTRKKLDQLIKVAEDNNAIFIKCRSLVLGLLASEDRATFLTVLENCFLGDFNCSAYRLIQFGARSATINHFTDIVTVDDASEHIGALMQSEKPTLGTISTEALNFLFPKDTDNVQSAVILPVRTDKLIAMLAIGSRDPDYFNMSQGTMFVDFISEILALLLPKYMT